MASKAPHKRISRPTRDRAVEQLLKGRALKDVASDLELTEAQLESRVMAQVGHRLGIKPVAWLFLSHAHEDSALAQSIAQLIESALGGKLGVFCTSSARDRIGPDLDSSLLPANLERAIGDRIRAALGVLLLVTPRAVRKDSRWIEYEIATGIRLAMSASSAATNGSPARPTSPGPQFGLIPCVCNDRSLVRQWDLKIWRSVFKEQLESARRTSGSIMSGEAAPSLDGFQHVVLSTDPTSNAHALWRLVESLADRAGIVPPEAAVAWWLSGAYAERLTKLSKLVGGAQ